MAAPAEVARGVFDAIAKKDLEGALALGADDEVEDIVAVGVFRGKAAIRSFYEDMWAAFPDFETTVERILGDDTTAVVQWRIAGTFSGTPFQGIEPTGRHVEIRGVNMMEIADGRMHHNTIYYDGASFARQIGMLPRANSLADKAILATFNATTRLHQRLQKK
jgi:steroid delta-isomerase-like uncharacterized protein